jgi:hypothetical protein
VFDSSNQLDELCSQQAEIKDFNAINIAPYVCKVTKAVNPSRQGRRDAVSLEYRLTHIVHMCLGYA